MRDMGRKHEKEIEDAISAVVISTTNEIERKAMLIGTTDSVLAQGVARKLLEVVNA